MYKNLASHTRAEECSTCAIAVWVRSQFSFKSAMIRPASSSCLNNNCWKIGKQLVGNICLLKYSIETFSVRVSVRASAKKRLVCIGLKSKKTGGYKHSVRNSVRVSNQKFMSDIF